MTKCPFVVTTFKYSLMILQETICFIYLSGEIMGYRSLSEMCTENFDQLVEDGKKIRALCDDNLVDPDDFRALFEIHTVFCYDQNVRDYFEENKDIALKVSDAYINAIEHFSMNPGSEINPESSIEDKFMQASASGVAEAQRMDESGLYENFFVSVLQVSKRLYESDDFRNEMIDRYFAEVLPKFSSYSEDDVEKAFERARARDAETQSSILEQYGVSLDRGE